MSNIRPDAKISIFKGQQIRKVFYQEEWWFSVVDVIKALEVSSRPRRYWGDLKNKLIDEGYLELSDKIGQLKLKAPDSKLRKTDCANTETMFRLIQSIPSKKAEPLKRWLAKVGYERVQEIENPELAQQRMKKLYEQKGYPKSWIDKRLRGMAIRQNLTDEWQERGIKEQKDYSILTAEISKATFGMTPSEYKRFKGISKKSKVSLRDNMTDLELIFTMLSEKVTTEISENEQPEGMPANRKVAQRGGGVAGRARKDTEKEIGRSVISKKGVLETGNEAKRLD